MDENKKLKPFGMKDKIGYGLGDFGCNMSFAFINNYLMLFYVTCMGIKPKSPSLGIKHNYVYLRTVGAVRSKDSNVSRSVLHLEYILH